MHQNPELLVAFMPIELNGNTPDRQTKGSEQKNTSHTEFCGIWWKILWIWSCALRHTSVCQRLPKRSWEFSMIARSGRKFSIKLLPFSMKTPAEILPIDVIKHKLLRTDVKISEAPWKGSDNPAATRVRRLPGLVSKCYERQGRPYLYVFLIKSYKDDASSPLNNRQLRAAPETLRCCWSAAAFKPFLSLGGGTL